MEGFSLRINQFLAHYTKHSRREAEKLVLEGRVKINHEHAKLANVVKENDKVFLDKRLIKPLKNKKFSVLVYHKPKGELVSKNDPLKRRVIYESLEKKYAHFVPVGRLDFASEGVLLLSDSKAVVSALMHANLEKEYLIKIQGFVTREMENAMQEGLKLENATKGAHQKTPIKSMEFAPFVGYEIIKNHAKYSKLRVIINEGKNRELRRFFAFFNAGVLDLRRVRYGFVNLNALPVGKMRFLNRQEYNELHAFMANAANLKGD
ncbi:pseudouridine synthase [Helicobacter pylori]|uniref:pseudouridine synthase n=1 Tax=Helicobacter pylori TaxID=210 RepID=UPI00358DAC8F